MDGPTVRNLKIIEININSIIKVNRSYELLNFINLQNPDIVLLNETKLKTNHKLFFQYSELILKDRSNASKGGGTAILIK